MDNIVQIVPISGYTAVFENVNDDEYHPVDRAGHPLAGKPVTDILAEADANLRVVPVCFFAVVMSELPRSGGEQQYRMVGVFLDPDYGYLELCERMDNETVYVGRFLGYLPPDPKTHPALMNNYRWITAARIDGRYVEETAWQQVLLLEEKKGSKK